MNFKESFEKYKNNTATEEEIRLVEEEIEKNSLISEYILDKEELNIDSELPENSEDYRTLNNIKKNIRARNISLILATLGTLLGLFLLFNFVGKPLLNMLYYNPEGHNYSTYNPDIAVSLDAYMELHNPNLKFNELSLERSGINKYNITINSQHYLTNKLQILEGRLIKDKLDFQMNEPNESGLHDSPFPAGFIYGRRSMDEFLKDDEETAEIEEKRRERELSQAKAYLSELPDYIDVGAYISFGDYLTMEQLTTITENEKYTNRIIFMWAGIKISDTLEGSYPMIGMSLAFSQDSRISYDKVRSKYKAFNTFDTLEGTSGPISRAYKEHFESMIQFQLDNLDFLNTLNTGIDYESYYKNVQSYINGNGIKSYGVIVRGTGDAILELLNDPSVLGIYIDDIALSTNLNGY